MKARIILSIALTLTGCGGMGQIGGGDDDQGGMDFIDAGPGGGGGGADAMDCPAVALALEPTVPTVLLLLDQSGSMTSGFGNTDRWNAMRLALTDPTTGVVTTLGDRVIFGASLYTSNNGNAGGTCPMLTTVAPALANGGAITTLLAQNGPSGDTPTGESIVAARELLLALPPNPASPLVIVLATDGEPDTCAVPNPQQGQPESIAAAQAAYAAGIKLFILSVGNEVGAPHQQAMANAGAGLAVDGSGGNAPFYSAMNPAELAARFNEIITGVRSCELTLSGTVDTVHAGEGTVKLDGAPLGYNDPNGWALVDADTIALQGSACDAFLTTPSIEVTAEFPCGVVVE